MNIYRFSLTLFFLLLFAACRQNHTADTAVRDKIDQLFILAAGKAPLPQRLRAAQTADSLAILTGNSAMHLKGIRTMATLFLKLDSTEVAGQYFREVIVLADSLGDTRSMAVGLNSLGVIYNERAVYDSSLICYTQAYELFKELPDTENMGKTLVNTGIVYKNKGDYQNAFSKTLEAIQLLEPFDSRQDLAVAYGTLGNALKEMGDFKGALEYHDKIMNLKLAEKDSVGIGVALNNIGNVYKSKKEYQVALDYYLRALDIKERFGNRKSRATTLDNLAETYEALGNIPQADALFNRALLLRRAINDLDGVLTTSNKLSRFYLSQNRPGQAAEIALQASVIMPGGSMLKQQLENQLVLGAIAERNSQWPAALAYHKQALILKDSLFHTDLSAAVSFMDARFQAEERKKELARAHQLEVVQSRQIFMQKCFITILVLLTVLLLVITVLLYRSDKMRKAANLRIESLMHELNHRVQNNLQLTSDMLDLQMSSLTDPSSIAVLQDTQSRLEAMNIIHGLLYSKDYNGTIASPVFLHELVENQDIVLGSTGNAFNIVMNIDDHALDADQAITLGLIVNELITNIHKHGVKDVQHPELRIAFRIDNGRYSFSLTDNCKPWQQPVAAGGFGSMLIATLLQQLGGTLEKISQPEGTTQLILFGKKH